MRNNTNEPAKRTMKPLYSFLLIAAFFQLMGGFIGWVTSQGVDEWYQTLHRSPLNPPDAVFGIVWTILYFLLSVSLWLNWKSPKTAERLLLLRLFVFHMILNWAWSPVFFTLHAVGTAFILLLLLIFTAAMIGWLSWRIDRRASLIFIPYMFWLIFAGHLCHYILQSN